MFVVALALFCLGSSPAFAAAREAPGAPTAVAEILTRPFTGLALSRPAAGAGARSWRQRKSAPGIALSRSSVRPYWACPEEACQAIIDPAPVSAGGRRNRVGRVARFALPAGPLLEGGGESGGLDPQDLQSAYSIPASGGEDQTVALVEGAGYPEAEQNLAVYREHYGLPPCTQADGCFHKVNLKGEEGHYPAASEGWETESALDLDMVSAACPHCHILLVQASSAERIPLSEGENTAARLGATEISNSWGSAEQTCGTGRCEEEAADFSHPGVMITAAGGDSGYNNTGEGGSSPEWPASEPTVVAVGGTVLHRAASARGWTEEVWPGGGSGCSRFAKPEWQTDPSCPGRMITDVAAVGACESPLSVYNIHGWTNVCGTSASTPLVAAIEAHASAFARSLPGAEAFYEDPGALFDVTKGTNGQCTPPQEHLYYCHAGVGYDGPTGMGSPDGPLQLTGSGIPLSTSRLPSAVGTGAATLNGVVVPTGLEASYRFEYGTSTSYGARVPVPDASVGSTEQHVSQSVTGLEPNTVYHYRLVASSSAGNSYGADEVFTTGTPTVTALSPATGAAGGATPVTITGTNLVGTSSVRFGSREAASFTVTSETSISAVSPQGVGGEDVTVTTPAGTSATGPGDRFSYDKPGPVLAWGRNRGMLGDGAIEQSEVPVEVSSLPEATSLATGLTQGLAVTREGRVMGWGRNDFGTVGDGTYEATPFAVGACAVGVSECRNGPYLEEATAVAAGGLHSLALLRDGTVVAWGGNLYGAIGGTTERSALPLPVCTVLESPCQPAHYLKEVVSIAAGATFSLALLRNGTVMAWGGNTAGELGNGATTGPEACGQQKLACSRVPVAVPGLSSVSAIAAGWGAGLALLGNGSVMSWGEDPIGELGVGKAALAVPTPTAVCATGEKKAPCKKHLTNVKQVAGAASDGYALLGDGTVVAFGNNAQAELGSGTPGGPVTCKVKIEKFTEKLPCSTVPVTVVKLHEVDAIGSGMAAADTLAHLQDDELVTWGRGAYGALGNGSADNTETPVGVCPPYAENPCPSGPHLTGKLDAMAVGQAAFVGLVPTPGPAVTGVQPGIGPAGGGTPVTIEGSGFTGASAVDFGAQAASEVQVASPDEITAISPAGSGTVDVTVTTPEGSSPTGPADRFIYQGAPSTVTGTAFSIARTTATLRGTVNPGNETVTECLFEYGTSPSYGLSVPCASLPGSGSAPVAVSAVATGLAPGTTYYFRVLAKSALGTGEGSGQSFTTRQLPEAGRCVKLEAASGRYSSSSCTTVSAGEDSGRYEWQPATAGQIKFSASGTAPVVETIGHVRKGHVYHGAVECTASALAGEFASPDTASLSMTLTGCHGNAEFFDQSCRTAGAAAGELKIGPLQAQLGFIQAGEAPTVGLALNPSAALAPLAQLECGSMTVTVGGGAIAPITTVDRMSTNFKLAFAGTAGRQTTTHLEGWPEDTLTLLETPAALLSSYALTGSEQFEIKATP